jgi:hypothetical protein
MEGLEISVSKLITGIGLFLDLCGVLILLYIERTNRRGDILSEASLNKQSYVDHYEAALEGKKLDKTEEQIEIEKLNQKLPLTKAQKQSTIALVLLTIGFLLQIISLFITH